jgi:hypothetical protein
MPDRSLAPYVTDHALVRYLERVMGLDMTDVRDEIAACVADGVSTGATAVIRRGFSYTLSGNRVTTVKPRHHASTNPVERISDEGE